MNRDREELSPDEQSMLALHDLILNAFRERFGETIIGVNLLPLVSECWITVLVKRKTQEMFDLAEEIEREFMEDFGKQIVIFFKRPWRERIRGLARNILPRAAKG